MSLSSPQPQDPIRILVVDDSAIIRGFISRALGGVDNAVIVGSVANGRSALQTLQSMLVDVVILDIEMPVMDGLTALPEILKISPWSRVLMSSTLTVQGAEVTMRAMTLGAADYVAKPSSTREAESTDVWQSGLVAKVQALGVAAWRERQRLGKVGPLPPGVMAKTASASSNSAAHAALSTKGKLYDGNDIRLRDASRMVPDIIAIGSSTGGPQALFQVLPHLCGLTQPIVITQHMPRTFTTILADHISKQTNLPCREGQNGEKIVGGRAYLAPGDFHMLLERKGSDTFIKITQDPPENFCRPSVDPMLRSVAQCYGPNKILMCILTGMGSDGLKGSDPIVNAGGTLVAQDQSTSVVWGMPGAVATAGLCSAVLPITEVGKWMRRKATGALS